MNPTPAAPSAPPGAALRCSGVTKRYGAHRALDGVSLEVAPGETVALVGESGSGKTTLLRLFNALVRPDEGKVEVEGRPVAVSDPVPLRRKIGYVPQEGGLLPHWTVERNAALVPGLLGLPDPTGRARDALERVGLDPEIFGPRFPGSLSGGQRQRVALARALAASPEVVLLDEPFGALDALTRGEILDVFSRVLEARRVTALLVTHDLRVAARLARRIAVLREGRVVQCATLEELHAFPADPYVSALLERGGLG